MIATQIANAVTKLQEFLQQYVKKNEWHACADSGIKISNQNQY
jgi:hypothetical protein